MITASDVKKGMVIEIEGQLYSVLDFQHIKMGRGSAQVRIKMKDLHAGHTTERGFQASEKFRDVAIELSDAQYMYQDGDFYYFMDSKSFEQIPLTVEQMGEGSQKYLKEGMNIRLSRYGDRTVGVEMPLSVELKVTETGPSFKGNTAQAATKPATLETGVVVQVPFFVSVGDIIRVDTRSGSYIERV